MVDTVATGINLAPQPPEPTPIDLGTGFEQPIPLSPEIARPRASRAAYGNPDFKSYEELFNQISAGNEDSVRKELSTNLNMKRSLRIQDFLTNVSRNRTLSPDEMRGALAAADRLFPVSDYASAFEDSFAKQYTGELDRKQDRKPNESFLGEAKQEIPQQVAADREVANTYVAKKLFIQHLAENAEQEAKNQSWLGWGADRAKELLPGYTEVQMRGNIPDAGFLEGGLLGENLNKQAAALWRLPYDQFKDTIVKVYNNLKSRNPGLASNFISAMVGQSTDEKNLNDVFTVLDATAYPGVAKVGLNIGRKAFLTTESQLAYKAMAREAEKAGKEPVKVVAADAAGDLPEAGVQKTLNNIVEATNGSANPAREAVDALPSVLSKQEATIRNNPGRFGQEIVNQITQSYKAFTDQLTSSLSTQLRVNRLPGVLKNEEAIRAIQAETKNNFTGLENSILDVSKPYREPVSNSYFLDVNIGRTGEQKIAFVDAEGKKVLSLDPKERWRVVDNADGTVSVARYDTKSKKYKVAEADKNIKISDTAAEGLHPTLLGRLEQVGESKTYRTARVGEPIATPKGFNVDVYIGNHGAEYFYSKEAATMYAKMNGLVDAEILSAEGRANSWFIKVTKPLDETSDVVRDWLVKTNMSKTPNSWLSAFAGWVRTPDETLAHEHILNRKLATYGAQRLLKVAKENTKEIEKFAGKWNNKTQFSEWKRTVNQARKATDPDTGLPGYFFKSPQELEEYYQQTWKRLPDQKEVLAYFSFVRSVEMDRILRNVSEYRNKIRVGAEQHQFSVMNKSGATENSGFFEGITRRVMPRGKDNSILITNGRRGSERVVESDSMSTTTWAELNDKVVRGELKVIEIHDPGAKPLTGYGSVTAGKRIRYVVTPTSETKRLSWDQVPVRGGGHFEYDYDWYIKQAKVTPSRIGSGKDATFKHWYDGDTTVMPMQIRAMGKDVVTKLNGVRVLLKDGKEAEALAYAKKHLPAIPWDDLHGWFKPHYIQGIEQPPRLSLHEPFHLIARDSTIGEVDAADLAARYPNTFKDGTRQGSVANQFRTQFTGQRDSWEVHTINDTGTRHNPLYKYEPAEMVDPITSLNRGLAKIVNSTFMDDYKLYAVEHWLQEAHEKGILKSGIDEIRYSPYWHFHNSEGNFVKATADNAAAIQQMKIAQFQIKQLIGTPSTFDTLMHSLAQTLADSIYTSAGPGRAVTLIPKSLLSVTKDGTGFLRSIAYHFKLGLYNIAQFIVQSNTYSAIYGIAGSKYATTGTMGAFLHQLSRINRNPEIIAKLDQMASRMNITGTARWKPGEFKEAMEALDRSGFEIVAHEYALRDNPLDAKTVQNAWGKFLDMGTVPFKEGERNTRIGAWYTAFKEYKDKIKPNGRLLDSDLAEILNRADTLTINMSRASSSTLHSGILSIPAQFLSYQLRMMELMLGKRLTPIEKTRLFATNAALYGVPTAFGVFGFPFGDYLRKKSLEDGYVVGDKYIDSIVNEGFPAFVLAAITGGGDPRKGNWYNIGDRFGTQGIETFRDALRSDVPWYKTLSGAAGSTVGGVLQGMDGFTNFALSFIRADDKYFPMTADNIWDAIREISSVNSAYRAYYAMNAGRWMSRKGQYLTDVSPANAAWMTATGLQPQSVSDAYLISWSLKDQKEAEKHALQKFEVVYRRGMQATADDNPDAAKTYFIQARAILAIADFPDSEIAKAMALAAKNRESLLDREAWDFYLGQHVPESERLKRRDTFYKARELKNNQKP